MDFTLSEDAGIEPRTVATLVLAVRSSDWLTTRLDLIEMIICTHQTFEGWGPIIQIYFYNTLVLQYV
jgi:hypothetical protein